MNKALACTLFVMGCATLEPAPFDITHSTQGVDSQTTGQTKEDEHPVPTGWQPFAEALLQ